MADKDITSETREYVAMCNKTNFNGYYFRQFNLPEGFKNNADMASWYFLNKVDLVSCIECVIPLEDYKDIKMVYPY